LKQRYWGSGYFSLGVRKKVKGSSAGQANTSAKPPGLLLKGPKNKDLHQSVGKDLIDEKLINFTGGDVTNLHGSGRVKEFTDRVVEATCIALKKKLFNSKMDRE